MVEKVKHLFNIRRQNKQYLFIILVTFILALGGAHFYSLHFDKYVHVKGYHIHHFYFGAICLALGGILGILSKRPKAKKIASGFIGVGLGLFSDEVGLLLNCTTEGMVCRYYLPDWEDIAFVIGAVIVFLLAYVDS